MISYVIMIIKGKGMNYYTKYVEPVIGNLMPLFAKKDFKDENAAEFIRELKKQVSYIKSPLFNMKTRKGKFATLSRFFYFLYHFYRINIGIQYANFYGDAEIVRIKPHESGNRKKATLNSGVYSDEKFSDMEILKKHRGILGRQLYRDAININKSNGINNASRLYLIPNKGVDVKKLYEIIDGIHIAKDANEATLDYFVKEFAKLSKLMRFRDADSANNGIRIGAHWLEQEMAEEARGKGKIARKAAKYTEIKALHRSIEESIQYDIEKQQALIDKLKLEAQTKMSDIVNDGAEVRIAAFKTAQIKLNKVVEAQQKLIELKNKLKETKELHKREEAEYIKSTKSNIAEHFYGLQK